MRPPVVRNRLATPMFGAALLLAALPLVGCHTPPSAEAKPAAADRRVVLEGDRVSVHNLVGELTVVRGEGPSVIAEVTPRGRDADRLRIEEGGARGVASLRIVYPSRRIHVPGFTGRGTWR